MEWESDRGLWLRMALALALVLILPFAFAYTVLFLLNTVGLALLEMLTEDPWNGRFYVEPPVLVGVVALGFAGQFVFGERVALRSNGARRVSEEDYPEVHAAVSRLSAQLEIPRPGVAISRSDAPNAFTVGRSPSSATIVLTTGLLERLDEDERDAVIAHELSHVKNKDVAVMTLAYFLPSLTYFVAIGAYLLLSGIVRTLGHASHVDDDGAKGLVMIVVVLTVSAILTLAVSVAFWIGSFLFFRVLSRYREYAADRGAAATTGKPLALASALRKLDDALADLPDADLREQDGGLEALYVAPIDDAQFGSGRELISRDLFPETHPPTTERIDRLEDLAGELETT